MLIIFFYLYFIALVGSSRTLEQKYRLPQDVLPDAYDIAIKPYLQAEDGIKQFTFEGEVNITLYSVMENVQNITLHKDNIDILETVLYDEDGRVIERIDTDNIVYDSVTSQLTIRLETPLLVQVKYSLHFKYTGQIRNDLGGIFRASYDNTSWYAITQLHRIDARTAFPCFDEPQLKATFRMSITRPKEYNSYFNTRLLDTKTESDGRYTDYFEKSPIMSTYLVAFLIGDFVAEGSNDLKLIMHPKFNNKTNFTQEVAVKAMDAFDSYTQMPYKTLGNGLMQMAGSVSFPHSGMENWGLIMYKDTFLAHEPQYTDGWSNKESTIMVLFHEMAHMWFGNSATHKWWSYFWLNEGFARYYQYFVTNEIYPQYKFDQQFIVKVIHKIFDLDATKSTQPLTSLEESIQSPFEIGYKFSNIAYDKGAAVVRMIATAMGQVNFDTAMKEYLKENHLKSATPEDLFVHWKRHWPAGHNVDLDQLFRDWTEQSGYPLIRLATTTSGKFRIKQERFLLNPEDGSDYNLKYTIPITYTTNRDTDFENLTPKLYLNKSIAELEFEDSKGNEWIILNLQQSNYHRVFYEAPLLERLRKAFIASNHSGIHIINRAQLVDDLFTYGRIGLLDYDVVFEFMEYLTAEVDYLPWQPVFKGLEVLYPRLTLSQHEKLGKFLYDILTPSYQRLGFENSNDTVLDVYQRNRVISWLCKYHHKDCLAQALDIFRKSATWFPQISPDFRETLYCAANRNRTDTLEVYYVLRQMFRSESLPSEKEKILRALGCTGLVDSHYSSILGDEIPQDLKPLAISSLYNQAPENIMPLFFMITKTVELLAENLGSWSTTATVISDLADYLTTEEQLGMYKGFIDTNGHLFGTSVVTLKAAVKTIEKNLAWSDQYLGKLFQYLDQRSGAISINSMVIVIPILAGVISIFSW